MSHCPGVSLEDWITDWYRVVDKGGEHGSGVRRLLYAGQLILTAEQFKGLVEIHEPIREHVESLMGSYSDEEHGSWRNYCDNFVVPDELSTRASDYLYFLGADIPKTTGILGNT